jgi:hypothetical protein
VSQLGKELVFTVKYAPGTDGEVTLTLTVPALPELLTYERERFVAGATGVTVSGLRGTMLSVTKTLTSGVVPLTPLFR